MWSFVRPGLGGSWPEGGNPTARRHGNQVTFQSASSPESRAILECTNLGLGEAEPASIWILCQLPWPHSIQPWDQGCSGSMDVTPAQLPEALAEYCNIAFSVLFSSFNFICWFIFDSAASSLLCRLFSHCREQGLFLVSVPRFLLAGASLTVEHWLYGAGLSFSAGWLSSCVSDSRAQAL